MSRVADNFLASGVSQDALWPSPGSFRESVKANRGNPSLAWAQISRANYQFKFYKGREGRGGEVPGQSGGDIYQG